MPRSQRTSQLRLTLFEKKAGTVIPGPRSWSKAENGGFHKLRGTASIDPKMLIFVTGTFARVHLIVGNPEISTARHPKTAPPTQAPDPSYLSSYLAGLENLGPQLRSLNPLRSETTLQVALPVGPFTSPKAPGESVGWNQSPDALFLPL